VAALEDKQALTCLSEHDLPRISALENPFSFAFQRSKPLMVLGQFVRTLGEAVAALFQ